LLQTCLLMQAASWFDGLLFDGFPPFEYGRSSAKVEVSLHSTPFLQLNGRDIN
jgi:hypothetical protein